MEILKKIIDVRGLACPMPVIEVKRAIENSSGDFQVITNSFESKENILRFLDSKKISANVDNEGAEFIISFKVDNVTSAMNLDENYQYICSEKEVGKSIIISKRRLGDGDEKLGDILIRSFFQTLLELDLKPAKLFFVNSGVFLTINDSPVLDELKKLYEGGVKIYSCGTCLDYYNVKKNLAIGEIGNMYLLVEILTEKSVFI